jgi:hypothetical protein
MRQFTKILPASTMFAGAPALAVTEIKEVNALFE